MILSDSDRETSVVREMAPQFSRFGFDFDPKASRLLRRDPESVHVITCNVSQTCTSLIIRPVLGLWFERIENVFEKAGVVEDRFAGVALTLSVDANILQGIRGFVHVALTSSTTEIAEMCVRSIGSVLRGRSTERPARDFARLASMRSGVAGCQNDTYPTSPLPSCTRTCSEPSTKFQMQIARLHMVDVSSRNVSRRALVRGRIRAAAPSLF